MGELFQDRVVKGTIAFATVGRPQYAFDVFAVTLPEGFLAGDGLQKLQEQRLTDGTSVNSNGHLVEGNAKVDVLKWAKERGGIAPADTKALGSASADEVDILVYVSERDGNLGLYLNIVAAQSQLVGTPESLLKNWGGLSERKGPVLLARSLLGDAPGPYLQDRPQVAGGRLVFVSTSQAHPTPRQSWNAVFSTTFPAPAVAVRLTPDGVSDYSPAVSPSGDWVAAASLQGRGWEGEVEELGTDIVVFATADGARRRLLVEHGGWPSWSDERTVFFHRVAPDGWWSVYRAEIPDGFLYSGGGGRVAESRVTPPGVHAFTPSASRTGDWIAVATRRPGSDVRHVEVFNLRSRTFVKVTEKLKACTGHYNPFVSASGKIVYHRCRGQAPVHGEKSIVPRLEALQSPVPGLALLRVDGTFPNFSRDGSLMVYCDNFEGLSVTKFNGHGKREIYPGMAFSTAWDFKRPGVIYSAAGGVFKPEKSAVHIIAVFNADASVDGPVDNPPQFKVLTEPGTGNNAFPAPSPDGKHVVFRSGRSGHKNLYIMDAVDGEAGGIRQLTDGPWTDTMPNWSPTGEWIAFSSNRDAVADAHFAGYLIRPDGSGLRRILSDGGRVNHLYFSPDGQSLVFTSDFAGVSAEPISTPNQFQPYGEIYISKIDGSEIQRLTHNAYEDGTPCWMDGFVDGQDLSRESGEPVTCGFDDMSWLAKGGDEVRVTVDEERGRPRCLGGKSGRI